MLFPVACSLSWGSAAWRALDSSKQLMAATSGSQHQNFMQLAGLFLLCSQHEVPSQVLFTFGYSLPLGSVAQRAANGTYQLRVRFSPAIAGLVINEFVIKVSLANSPAAGWSAQASPSSLWHIGRQVPGSSLASMPDLRAAAELTATARAPTLATGLQSG